MADDDDEKKKRKKKKEREAMGILAAGAGATALAGWALWATAPVSVPLGIAAYGVNRLKKAEEKKAQAEEKKAQEKYRNSEEYKGRLRTTAELDLLLAMDPEQPLGLRIDKPMLGMYDPVYDGKTITVSQFIGLVRKVEEVGGNLNARWSDTGENLLLLAAKCNNVDVVRYMLNKWDWLDVNSVDHKKQTALHLAIKHRGNGGDGVQCVRLLSQNGANLNSRDEDGNTPLHVAARSRNCGDVIRELMNGGANSLIENHDRKTASECAIDSNKDIIALERSRQEYREQTKHCRLPS